MTKITGKEYIVVGTGAPAARAWGQSAAEAVEVYKRAFAVRPGANVIVRAAEDHASAELFNVQTSGLTRLVPGGGK